MHKHRKPRATSAAMVSNQLIAHFYDIGAFFCPHLCAFPSWNRKVSAECFASPLNWQTQLYCSAFKDTDAWFGSQGSFFNFLPTEDGSYEVVAALLTESDAVFHI